MALIPGLENLDFTPYIAKIAYYSLWVGMGVGMLIIIGLFYYFMTFDYKITVLPVFGDAKGGFGLGKKKSNRARWATKEKTAWRIMKPWFNKRDVAPFSPKHIYSGKQVYAAEIEGQLIPMEVMIDKLDDGSLLAQMNPVPHYIRNWQTLELKKIEAEFAEPGWWENNKQFLLVIITAVLCLGAVCFTVWFTYSTVNGSIPTIESLTGAVKNFGNVPGVVPH